MTSFLFSMVWFLLNGYTSTTAVNVPDLATDSLPTKKQPVELPSGTIRLWPGPLQAMKGMNPGPEELQISQSVHQIVEDRTGGIWIATGEAGVCLFDGTDYHYFTTADGLAGNTVRTIIQDADGAVWMATNGGISRRTASGFTTYTTANGLPDNEVLTLHIDRKGTLWAGTSSGLAKFDKDGFVSLPMFREPRAEKDQPLKTPVSTIYEDKSGQLWFGTNGFGLFMYNGKTLINVIKPGC